MTVAELIEELKKHDADLPVLLNANQLGLEFHYTVEVNDAELEPHFALDPFVMISAKME